MSIVPYKLLTPDSLTPDFASARKYESILRRASLNFNFDRHQLIFTDDIERTGMLIAQYFLHIDPYFQRKRSPLEDAMIGLSLSNEEVALSGNLYVGGDETPDPAHDIRNDPAVNQKRYAARIFQKAVKVDFNDPSFPAWAEMMWQRFDPEHYLDYKRLNQERRDIMLFTDWQIAPATLAYFEANFNSALFINTAKSLPWKGLRDCLYMESSYGQDHRDYIQRIPPVIWVLPFDQYGKFKQAYDLDSGIAPMDYPSDQFLLHKPLDTWLAGLEDTFREDDAERAAKGYLVSQSDYMTDRLQMQLDSIADVTKRLIAEKNLQPDRAMQLFGLSKGEYEYLLAFGNEG